MSVIIPALNEEKLLPGLLAQLTRELRARHALEVIVSDGGSDDATRGIAGEHDCVLVEFNGDGRQTIAGGRNEGAAAAGGELLIFVNADVRFRDADAFFGTARRALSDAGVAGATCAVQVYPEEERLSDRLFHCFHNAYVRFLNFIGEGMGRGECQIVRRSLFEELGGYNSTLAAGEDYELFRRVRRRGRIAYLSRTVVFESPRRFRRCGYLRIIFDWTRNAVAVVVRKKSSSEEWEAVR